MKERLIISIILLLMAYAVCGCEEEPEYSNDFLYSEYEWTGPFCDDFAEYMCWKANIDFNDGEWRISCPKCGVAYIEQRSDGVFITNFTIDATVEPMRIACQQCLYPIGRDWKIVDIEPNEASYKDEAEN